MHKFSFQSFSKQQWAWIFVDFGNAAFSLCIQVALFPLYLHSLVPEAGLDFVVAGRAWHTTPLSIWAYTVSLSMFCTFILALWLGAWADEGGHRKLLFTIFTIIGCTGSLFLGVFQSWPLALLAYLLSNIGFSGSFVFYNSLLQTVSKEKKNAHALSFTGFAFGYLGGGLILLFDLLLISKFQLFGFESKTSALRFCLSAVGIWWFVFSLPAILWLREEKIASKRTSIRLFSFDTLRSLGKTLASLKSKPELLIILLSFGLMYEGIATVKSVASLFGKEVLHLPESTLIGTLLMIQFLGLPFTLMLLPVSRKIGSFPTLKLILIAWILVALFSYNMQSPAHFWMLGAAISLVLGTSQALPRSIFAQITPPDRQGEFFALFGLTGKMTASLGPLFFGLLRDLTGNPRIAIAGLAVLFLASLILLEIKTTFRSRRA